jgi:hypothetical protein
VSVCVCVYVCVHVCVCHLHAPICVDLRHQTDMQLPRLHLTRLWDSSVTAVSQRCHSGATAVLQWCHSGVTAVLQWCCSGVAAVDASENACVCVCVCVCVCLCVSTRTWTTTRVLIGSVSLPCCSLRRSCV